MGGGAILMIAVGGAKMCRVVPLCMLSCGVISFFIYVILYMEICSRRRCDSKPRIRVSVRRAAR